MEELALWLSIIASILSIISVGWNKRLQSQIIKMKNSGERNINSKGNNSINNTGNIKL